MVLSDCADCRTHCCSLDSCADFTHGEEPSPVTTPAVRVLQERAWRMWRMVEDAVSLSSTHFLKRFRGVPMRVEVVEDGELPYTCARDVLRAGRHNYRHSYRGLREEGKSHVWGTLLSSTTSTNLVSIGKDRRMSVEDSSFQSSTHLHILHGQGPRSVGGAR